MVAKPRTDFLDTLANPLMVVLNVVALAFVLLHTITFANLTPRAMVVKLRGRRVPSRAILAGVYFGWLVVTAVLPPHRRSGVGDCACGTEILPGHTGTLKSRDRRDESSQCCRPARR